MLLGGAVLFGFVLGALQAVDLGLRGSLGRIADREARAAVDQVAALALYDRPRSLTQIIPDRVHSYRFIFQSP